MYYLNGEPLRLDRAFTDADGNQYPANWLRNSTQEQRDALGITWVAPDPAAYYDQRFYWGVGNPKDLDGLKELWVEKQKQAAGTLLAPTDWYVTRKYEKDIDIPVGIASFRDAVRDVCESRKVSLDGATDLTSLVGIVTFAGLDWPQIDF